MKSYSLTKNGCNYGDVYARSFKHAREEFNNKFSGSYKIICNGTGESKNVRLK